MSLESLLQATLPPKLTENKPVGPTLLVGLGGTGKEILLRFRRLVVERYGSRKALPFIEYLNVDTDTTAAAKEQYSLRAGDDPLYDEVRFDPAERIDLTIEGGTAKYVEHIASYPNIKRWFPSSGKIAGLGNLGDGAGQVRIASRLGLFHGPNFSKLSSQIAGAQKRLKDPAILHRAAEMGFQFDAAGMTVVVCCSLAGGTGGGTFLDLGFLLAQYFPSAERVGILMLPGFFSGYAGGERVLANGYAALMELSHYSFGHTFIADWQGDARAMLPPPFTTTYLIDASNEAGFVINSGGKEYDAYRMVAEALFQDFSVSSFAGMKRATKVNLVQFNLDVRTHNFLNEALRAGGRDGHKMVAGDTFPTRFGSFGLATISFPTDRVHAACGSRLASEILDFWQNELVASPLDKLFTDFLLQPAVRFVQGRHDRQDGGGVIEARDLEDALLIWDEGGGRTFPSHLWEKAQSIRHDLEASPVKQKASRLAFHRQELDKFLAMEDSDNPDEWGSGIRQLEENYRVTVARLKAGIEARAKELSSDPRKGVAFALSLLRELRTLLRHNNYHYLPHFDAEIDVWRDEAQQQAAQLDQLQLELQRHERQLMFRGADLEHDMERLVGTESSLDVGVLYSYYFARVMKQVAKRGRRICEEIERFLGKDDVTGDGLLARYYNLLTGFKKLRDRLQAKLVYFSRQEPSKLTLDLYREGDVDRWYELWMGERASRHEILKRLGNQLLKDIFGAAEPTAALDTIARTSVDEIEGRMLGACKRHFAGQERQPEALALLFDGSRFSTQERQEAVRQAFRLAKVWLEAPKQGLDHIGQLTVRADQCPCLIGVHDGDAALAGDFKSLVQTIRAPGDSPPSFLSVGAAHRGMIVFYNELAGVPAFYPNSITTPGGLREAYRRHREKDELHTDKNRFQFIDLVPKTAAEARRYVDSLQAFAVGRLLGLLRVRELTDDEGVLSFRYSYRRSSELGGEDVQLGDEQQAVDYLFHDEQLSEAHSHRQELLAQIESVLERLRAKQLLWVYGLLLELYLREAARRTRTETKWATNLTYTQYSPEFAVLSRAKKQLSAMVSGPEELKKLREAMEKPLGKRLGEELQDGDLEEVLALHCKEAGKFVQMVVSEMGVPRPRYRPALVLDLAKLDKAAFGEVPKVPPRKPATPRISADAAAGTRPCPSCQGSIDARAIFCIHCKKVVAEHRTCAHCDEKQVPGDLEQCWKCGSPMREDEKLTCPRCYGFTAYEDQYPCPICGYDPKASEWEAEPAPASNQASSALVEGEDEEARPNGSGGLSTSLAAAAGTVEVECPSCFSLVPLAPRCQTCGGLLEL